MKHCTLLVFLLMTNLLAMAQSEFFQRQNAIQNIQPNEQKVDTYSEACSVETASTQNEAVKFLIAYELGEAVFNKFQSLSGEVGFRFKNQQLMRLVHVNLKLTEEHLSSGFAGAVDGENVKGKQFGFEAFYDFPVFFKGLYLSPSIGYFENEYQHTLLDERIKNASFSLGSAVSYREIDIFKLKGFYFSVSFPLRINLNPIEETKLGDALITNSTIDNNIWLFLGYEF